MTVTQDAVPTRTLASRLAAVSPAVLMFITMLLSAVMLVAGYADKARCVGPEFDALGRSTPDLYPRMSGDVCYSDIQALWTGREINTHVFPYVHGGYDPATGAITGGSLEYPVLTGVAIWISALPADNDGQFLTSSAVLLGLAGLLVTFLLVRLAGWRSWWWALAPPIVLYAFHNWDLFAVACVVGAFACVYGAERGTSVGLPGDPGARNQTLAAVLLGLGGAFKFYPLMFLLPIGLWLALGRTGQPQQWRAGIVFAAIGAGTYALANLPFALINFDGWWAAFQFQAARPIDATTNSIWYWAARPFSDSDNHAVQSLLSELATLTTAIGLAGCAVAGWWRRRRLGVYPWLQVSAAMLCVYLLLNKVHSPQYVLWLVPFFVLLRIRAGWILAYFVADAATLIGFFRWQYLRVLGQPFGVTDNWPMQALMVGVWGRAALLLGLTVAFLAAEPAVPPATRAHAAGPRPGNHGVVDDPLRPVRG